MNIELQLEVLADASAAMSAALREARTVSDLHEIQRTAQELSDAIKRLHASVPRNTFPHLPMPPIDRSNNSIQDMKAAVIRLEKVFK